MKNASLSILVFGIYVVVSGLGFLLIPNLTLATMGLPPTNEVWIRVLGLLATVLGLYYVQASRDNNHPFYVMSIWGRILVAVGIGVIVLFTPNSIPLLLVAVLHVAGAAWTWYADREEFHLVKSF